MKLGYIYVIMLSIGSILGLIDYILFKDLLIYTIIAFILDVAMFFITLFGKSSFLNEKINSKE